MSAVQNSVRVRNGLENAIIDGRFPPGMKLDLDELAREYNCSRTPIREAVQQLERSGLVRVAAKHGTFVTDWGIEEITERFEVMAELEAMCARLAARRIDDNEVAALEAAHERCGEVAASGDVDGYYRENSVFHGCIYKASHNEFLVLEASRLYAVLRPYRRKQLQVRHRMRHSFVEHATIVAAIVAGDAQGAADAMREHVLIQGDRFYDVLLSLRHER